MIWYYLDGEYSRMCFKPLFCCRVTPQHFCCQKHNFQNVGHGHFSKNELSSKTRFLCHWFELISHKSGSHGPYRQLWFSVNKSDWIIKFPSKSQFLEKTHFSKLYGKWIDFMGVVFPSNPFSGPLVGLSQIFFRPLKNWTFF